MKKALVFIVIALAFAGAGYWYYTQNQNARLVAVSPMRGPVVQAVYASGTAEPTVMLPIAPRTGARLTGILAHEGSVVKKGDILAQLENADLQKSSEELQARLDLTYKEFNRKDALRKSGAISKSNFDTARSNLEAARAALEQAQAQLDYLTLKAPEDGRIIKRDGEVGEFIPTGQAVFWMECCAPMRITADVDEEDIPLVKPGQNVLISADAYPGDTFEGTVQSITPKGDEVARSFRVRIELDEKNPLMTGMTAEVNIITREQEDALLVPVSAVRNNKIWVIRDGTIVMAYVKTGAQSTGSIEITEGITENDIVLKNPASDQSEGDPVEYTIEPWVLRE